MLHIVQEIIFYNYVFFPLIYFNLFRKKWRQCNRWCDLRIVFRSRNSRPSTIREGIPVPVIRWNLNVLNVHPAKGRKNPPNIFERLPLLEDGSFLRTCDNLSVSKVNICCSLFHFHLDRQVSGHSVFTENRFKKNQ